MPTLHLYTSPNGRKAKIVWSMLILALVTTLVVLAYQRSLPSEPQGTGGGGPAGGVYHPEGRPAQDGPGVMYPIGVGYLP